VGRDVLRCVAAHTLARTETKEHTAMALSINELELQSTEYLPAREVMTSWGGPSATHKHVVDGPDCNTYTGGILNGTNVQDVVSDIDVRDIQVGLVNVNVHDVNDFLDLGTANSDVLTNIAT
jgi:hypothetical protein